jgi:E3 ubiquitin-protein ligase SHPRH
VVIQAQIINVPQEDLEDGSGGETSSVVLKIINLEAEELLSYSCDDPALFDLFDQIQLASRLASADRFSNRVPTACYQASLSGSPDEGCLHLEIVVLWVDSLEAPDIKHLSLPVLEVFTKYVLQEEYSRPSNSTEERELREAVLGISREWTPRKFYESVHVPETKDSAAENIKCPDIECQLFPFQRRAVRWLLQREWKDVQQDGKIVCLQMPPKSAPPASFDSQKDADGNIYYFSHLFMTLTTDTSQWHDAADHLRGGILAEEMGLGKTVEMIALICLNRRDMRIKADPDGLRPSGATLIITPPAILEQWKQELEKHAPSLNVHHYTGGLKRGKTQVQSDDSMVDELVGYDVVLTTYNVISKEIYYAGAVPKRNLRHEKKFEHRKTPLVRISWWRVCLDEAQMVESGVSHAAQVARVIPREIAWAVTGTPLRKNIDDLFGLLVFLHYGPFCYSNPLWKRLYSRFGPILVDIIGTLAIRHSKDSVRDELRLPPQKRIVITTPFTPIEEQHYGQLFESMSIDCGLDASGAPLRGDWNPDDPKTIEKMRMWLSKLRQTCLHPEIGGNSRRALGGSGPLRTVDEVLEVMIETNDASIRSEERILLLSQLRRGQLLENAKRRQEALDIWLRALDRCTEMVKESREQLRLLQKTDSDKSGVNSTEDVEETDKNSRLGQCRLKLRGALEVQHIAVFFTANAYYQIKSDPNLTQSGSDEFKALETREEDGYEAAKVIRKEMLTDISRKVERHMETIKEKARNKQFVIIPKMKPEIYSRGIEAYNLLCNFEDLCEALNKNAEKYKEWRDIMVKLVSQSLIDQEDEAELEGNEYERSTKHQDEMYVYMEGLRTMYADRHDCLTGQKNVLISYEVKAGIAQAQKGDGPSPKLFLEIMNTRSELKPDPEFGSLRKIVSDLRSLLGTLYWSSNSGSSRARAEHEVVELVLQNAGQMLAEQMKVSANLDREVEMFRDAMNNRLEYYRHLQQISDTVAPYDEESAGQPLDEDLFAAKLAQEELIEGRISTLKSKARYLDHLRGDSSSDPNARTCIICQSSIEIGEHDLLIDRSLSPLTYMQVC